MLRTTDTKAHSMPLLLMSQNKPGFNKPKRKDKLKRLQPQLRAINLISERKECAGETHIGKQLDRST